MSQRNSDHFDKLLQRIKDVKKGIEEGKFEAKEGAQCRYCLHECPLNANKANREAYLRNIAAKNE